MGIIAYASRMFAKYRFFILYSIIGGSGVIIDFIAFYILNTLLGMHYQFANILSVSLGITNNFILNAFFNFRMTDKLASRFVKFYLVGVLGMAASAILLYVLIDHLFLIPLVAKSATIVCVVLIQFTLNKKITFKQNESGSL